VVKGVEVRRCKCLLNSDVGVEKLSDWTELVRAGVVLRVVLLLSGDSWRFCWLAEEAHESLDVLGHRCQEELLSNELHAP
jgi:hypothetical protein